MRGQSTIFVMDESFVHEKHVSAFTWNATGEDGKAQRDLAGTKGRGKMLIMCGGIFTIINLGFVKSKEKRVSRTVLGNRKLKDPF